MELGGSPALSAVEQLCLWPMVGTCILGESLRQEMELQQHWQSSHPMLAVSKTEVYTAMRVAITSICSSQTLVSTHFIYSYAKSDAREARSLKCDSPLAVYFISLYYSHLNVT